MAVLLAPAAWLAHPLAEALLRFNLLPSLDLHASRIATLLPADLQRVLAQDGGAVPPLHRHWSAALSRSLELDPVLSLDDPALPLALLPAAAFDRLGLWCGVMLLGPAIRRTIARDAVLQLKQELGEDALAFARIGAAGLYAGGDSPPPLEAAVALQASRWGAGLLAGAFEAATPAVARRGVLRLPETAPQARAGLPPGLSEGGRALALARRVVEILDPAWLSLFPAIR